MSKRGVCAVLSKLTGSSKVVGAKQTRRALSGGQARTVYLAQDADPRVTGEIRALCQTNGVPVCDVATMRELGQACGIAVGAAVAALLS
jgi:large subunit ribosomal protein L7A